MGCADGVVLPTLSQCYERVAAIDVNPCWTSRAQRLVTALDLHNVRVVCGENLSPAALRAEIGPGFGLMYLLETLEHVGAQPDMWGSKVEFLRESLALLERGGRIVISVPKMVGPVILIKNLLQRSLGRDYDRLSWRQLVRSAFWNDTLELEPAWNGGHLGFNHLRLERHLAEHFTVYHRSESAISAFYVIGDHRHP